MPRVDDRRVISGIIHVIRHGLMWRDATARYGPHKTLYNRFTRWSEIGVFERIVSALAAESTALRTVMIDATHLKAPPVFSKRGYSPTHRTHQGRPEFEVTR